MSYMRNACGDHGRDPWINKQVHEQCSVEVDVLGKIQPYGTNGEREIDREDT